MMNTILVPIDFSSESINALRTALDIAKQSNSQVIMLHNITGPEKHPSDEDYDKNFKLIDSNTLKESNAELLDSLEELRGLRMQYHVPKLKINFMASYHLDSKELYQMVEQKKIGLMILGKKLNSVDSDFQLGNLYLEKNAKDRINLLVLAIDQYYSRINYDKILLKVDSSVNEYKLFDLINEFASILDMEVYVKDDLSEDELFSTRFSTEIENSMKNDNFHLISNNPELPDELSEVINGLEIDLAATLDANKDFHHEIDQLPVHKVGYANTDLMPAFVQEVY